VKNAGSSENRILSACCTESTAPALGCVIMASGLGRRFGSNKLMADFRGEPMLASVLRATDGIFAARVVITRHREVADYCSQRQIPCHLHSLPYRSDTIRLGLSHMGDAINGCMFCPGDQPLLSRETITAMTRAFTSAPENIWQLAFDGKTGTPVIFPRSMFSRLRSLSGSSGGRVVLQEHPELIRHVTASDPAELQDVDTPEDLKALLAASPPQ